MSAICARTASTCSMSRYAERRCCARDSGEPAITAMVRLASEAANSNVAGFLMYLPVYRAGAVSGTAEQRLAAFVGWVNAPFRIPDLIAGLPGKVDDHIDLEIYDGTQTVADRLISDEDGAPGGSGQSGATRLAKTVQVSIHGNPWTILFASQPRFETWEESFAPAVVLAAGGTISGLLFWVVLVMASRLALIRESQQRFARLANVDVLTGLPNRAMFTERLKHAIDQ